jgi:hypothetical protein
MLAGLPVADAAVEGLAEIVRASGADDLAGRREQAVADGVKLVAFTLPERGSTDVSAHPNRGDRGSEATLSAALWGNFEDRAQGRGSRRRRSILTSVIWNRYAMSATGRNRSLLSVNHIPWAGR